MLRSRVIPCLLVHQGGLVKTVRFKDPKYVGDPLNAVKIFNEKEVDELMVVDIDATVTNREPNFGLIEQLAVECRMPLCYGGGVRSVEQAKRIVSLGVEKVALSAALVEDPSLASRIADAVGTQSVVAVLDVKKSLLRKYELYIHNGRKRTPLDPFEHAAKLESLGVGEVVVNAIDRDGTFSGYDRTLIARMRDVLSVPLTVLGGAKDPHDIASLISDYGIIGAAAGSLFVFKGPYRAVLINYSKPASMSHG
ncbi:MAG: imidazole glycerol phosphate synthase subunit HisF [Bdellovibrionales bacterium]|nr:imidazole glycerol phosphate synthase subunit HisF [Bdellovibrionales bacterium]